MAIELDELEPRKAKAPLKELSTLSVAELEDYISRLEGEIARARAAIAAKQAHRSGAEALFKK